MADNVICGVTVTILREHIETDASTEALERLLSEACAAVTDRIGPEGEQTTVLRVFGNDRYIWLPRPVADASAISSIVERYGMVENTLADTDWRLVADRQIERLVGGANSNAIQNPTVWGFNFVWSQGNTEFQVVVTYTPVPEDRRVRVLIDLVRLALQYNAVKSETAGDYSSSALDYQKERIALIGELVRPLGFA